MQSPSPSQALDRRTFLKAAAAPTLALPLGTTLSTTLAQAQSQDSEAPDAPPGIVDTNLHVGDWPFRHLKYSAPRALADKLKQHRIVEGWAGSFEALFHKNLSDVNARLAVACRGIRDLSLRPVGALCPVWPGWEEDLRRCHEIHKMPAIRLYPAYHQYRLDRPEIRELFAAVQARGMFVQVAIDLEDPRVHHPALQLEPVDVRPLTEHLQAVPEIRVQLLNAQMALSQPGIASLLATRRVTFDLANLEGAGAIGRLLAGNHWSIKTQLHLSHLMFGSHAPFFPLEAALLRLFESPLDRSQLVALMQGNARHWLPPGPVPG
ncbi:MAG: metal-dependent hydrolase [Planctomycetes bacterium]|nr:metal-dependent hydrolase [Planctomycetota bacterium]